MNEPTFKMENSINSTRQYQYSSSTHMKNNTDNNQKQNWHGLSNNGSGFGRPILEEQCSSNSTSLLHDKKSMRLVSSKPDVEFNLTIPKNAVGYKQTKLQLQCLTDDELRVLSA